MLGKSFWLKYAISKEGQKPTIDTKGKRNNNILGKPSIHVLKLANEVNQPKNCLKDIMES